MNDEAARRILIAVDSDDATVEYPEAVTLVPSGHKKARGGLGRPGANGRQDVEVFFNVPDTTGLTWVW